MKSLLAQLRGENPGPGQETQPGLTIVQLCWDPLFAFFIRFFKPLRPRKAIVILENLAAETTTNFKKVFSWEVESGFEGIINEISLVSSRFDTTEWKLTISGQEQFTGKKIHASLTLPWKELPIFAGQKVVLEARTTDGVATNIDGCLIGEMRLLTGK